jgi:hypothetical protein
VNRFARPACEQTESAVPETPAEAIVRALSSAERSLTLAQIVELSGVGELEVVDALPALLRTAVVEPDPQRGRGLRFRLSGPR